MITETKDHSAQLRMRYDRGTSSISLLRYACNEVTKQWSVSLSLHSLISPSWCH